MAQCNTSCSSVLDASYEPEPQPKVCAVSIQARIAAFEGNMSFAANITRRSHLPQPVFEGRIKANDAQNVTPPSHRVAHLFKSAKRQTHTDVSGSSAPSHLKNVMKSGADVSSKSSVSPASANMTWINSRRPEAAKTLKPETLQESNVPNVHQITKLPLAQQNKEQCLTHTSDGTERTKAPKLPKKPNHIRICGTQNEVQRENTNLSVPKRTNLPDVFDLGNPPPKPNRPPRVDIHQCIRNIKSLKDRPGMMTLRYVTPPPTPPPLRLCPSSSHAAALSQQMDEDETYDDVGIMNPPPLPKEHPSMARETDLGEDMYEELDDRWLEQAEKLKKHQESNSGKEVTNYGKVAEEKQTEPNGTVNSKEMKRKDIKAKKEEKKLWKQQRAKEKKREQKAKKKKIKGPIQVIMKGKGKPDLCLNQDVYTESVDTGPEEEEEPGSAETDIYDDIGAPEEVCSGLAVQNFWENHVYDDVDNPDARVSPLTQPATDESDAYDNINSQNHLFDGYDIYCDDVKEDSIYENVKM